MYISKTLLATIIGTSLILSGCNDGNDSTPTPTPTPTTVADKLAGEWIQGSSNLGISDCNLAQIEILKTGDNSVEGSNEGIQYSQYNSSLKTCGGELVSKRYQLLGDLILKDIQTGIKYDNFFYYPIKYQKYSTTSEENRVLTFLDDDSFCIINSTSNNPAYIKLERNSISNPYKDNRCYVKSNVGLFTAEKPKNLITTANFLNVDAVNSTSSAAFLSQLNEMGKNGYKIVAYNNKVYGNQTVNSYMKLANQNTRYSAIVSDRTASSISNIYFSWLSKLNENGKSGYQFLHSVRPSTDLNFKDYFLKNENDNASYTYDSGYLSPFVDTNQLINVLNELGQKGCRIIQFKQYFTGNRAEILDNKENQPKIATCINSSKHNGTYTYRYKDYPTESTKLERALALQNMINAQAKDGYRLVSRSLDISATKKNGLLFMKDSEALDVGEFKVFSEEIFSNTPILKYLNKRFNQQGQIGWLYTNAEFVYTNNPKSIQADLNDFQIIE